MKSQKLPSPDRLLVEFDAETRFRLRAARGAGKVDRGLTLLDKAFKVKAS